MRVRVAVIDNEEGGRVACKELLGRHPAIEVVDLFTPPEALARAAWDDVDVVLLDAGDVNDERDNIPGAGVAGAIRALHPSGRPGSPTIIVLTSYHREGAVLLRMKDAGADYIESRGRAMRSAEALQQVVLAPHQLAEPNPPEGLRSEIGLRPGVNSNEVVKALNEVAETYGIGTEHLDPDAVTRADDPDRTKWTGLKGALVRYLDPRDVQGKWMQGATTPQKKQIRRVWRSLTRVEDRR